MLKKSMYDVNPKLYKRNGQRRPGATCEKVNSYIRTDDVSKIDRDNRIKVIQAIKTRVESGMNLEKAVLIVVSNQKVKKAFQYLTNAGIDLKELFMELYTRESNRKNRESYFSR